MDFGLKGKKAIVTGASRGIGASIAINLAREGASVAIVARTESDLNEVMNLIGGVEKGHYMVVADLTAEGTPKKVFQEILENFGKPDILVNNLGSALGITDPFCSLNDWRKIFRMNLEVAIELNNLAIPFMKKKGWGRIVNISSTAGMENNGPITYCTAKAALTAYTRSLGRVLAKSGIVLSAIMPGAVFTKGGHWDIAMKERPEHVEKYLKERCPMGKFGDVEDIGTMATVLCSNQAKFCQGSIFPVDGGQSRHYFWTRDW